LGHEINMVVLEAHEEVVGGPHAGKKTTQNILHAGLWWPTLNKDAKEFYQSCNICERLGKPSRKDEIPLAPQVLLQAFEKWEVDFVGTINPPTKRSGARYIIATTKYLTRWAKEELVRDCIAKTTV